MMKIYKKLEKLINIQIRFFSIFLTVPKKILKYRYGI